MRNCKIILIYLSIFLFCLPAFGNVNDDLFKAIEDGDAKKVQSLLNQAVGLFLWRNYRQIIVLIQKTQSFKKNWGCNCYHNNCTPYVIIKSPL